MRENTHTSIYARTHARTHAADIHKKLITIAISKLYMPEQIADKMCVLFCDAAHWVSVSVRSAEATIGVRVCASENCAYARRCVCVLCFVGRITN